MGIYSRLLERIAESGFDVSRPVSLPVAEKWQIVLRGGWGDGCTRIST